MEIKTIQYKPLDFRQSITIDLDSGLDVNIIEDGEIYSIKDYIRKVIQEEKGLYVTVTNNFL